MRSNLIALIIVLMCGSLALSAQNSNPFELLWRKDSAGSTVKSPVSEPPVEAEAIETPAVAEAPPPPIEPIAITPTVEDTISIQADTPLTNQETAVIDSLLAIGNVVSPDTLHETISEDSAEATIIPAVPEVKPEMPVRERTPLILVLLFGVIFSLLAWGLSLNRELLKKIYRAALNENLSSLLFREQRFATTQYLYYTIYLIFFVNGGMFLYFLSGLYGWGAWALQSVWMCIGLVTLVYLLRHLFLSILGSAYPVTKETSHFSFSIVLHNILLGISLIPVNLFLAFGPEGMHRTVAVIGLLVCGVIYLMRQFRGLLIGGASIGTNPFHFFVYLCAVEILPLFTLVKFFHH